MKKNILETMSLHSTRQVKGQGLAEYALVLLLVAIIIIVGLSLFGDAVGNMYSTIVASI